MNKPENFRSKILVQPQPRVLPSPQQYVDSLHQSLTKSIASAAFEPNGEELWAKVRRTLEDILLNECQKGALLGTKAEQAFFVKCDRTTMTQNDLDHGRLICLVGVAPVRPAEFVIFQISQITARAAKA